MSSNIEKIGGKKVVQKLVSLMYSKMLQSDELRPFFDYLLDMPSGMLELERKQVSTFSYLLGSPDEDALGNLKDLHRRSLSKGLNESHFKVYSEILSSCFEELQIDSELRDFMLNEVEKAKKLILNL